MSKSFKHQISVATCDIRHGVPKDCSKCPIARRVLISLAARFRRWDKIRVEVGGSSVDVRYRDGRGKRREVSAKLPSEGQNFITWFDGLPCTRVGRRLQVNPNQAGAPVPFTTELVFSESEY